MVVVVVTDLRLGLVVGLVAMAALWATWRLGQSSREPARQQASSRRSVVQAAGVGFAGVIEAGARVAEAAEVAGCM